VVIAGSTRRLTGGLFDYHDLGTVALKGFAEKLPAWQVMGPSGAQSGFEALRAITTQLAGRDEEIELLQRRWNQAKPLISHEPAANTRKAGCWRSPRAPMAAVEAFGSVDRWPISTARGSSFVTTRSILPRQMTKMPMLSNM
jgi:hypothetical protein